MPASVRRVSEYIQVKIIRNECTKDSDITMCGLTFFCYTKTIYIEGRGGGHSGADLEILCKHFNKLKYYIIRLNFHFVDVKFKETWQTQLYYSSFLFARFRTVEL